MNRTLSNLSPALWMAAAVLAASALAKAAPHSVWAAVAAPLVLVVALLVADAVLSRRAGGPPLPSLVALVLAAGILGSCGILASAGLDRLAEMIPILGACAVLPILQRREGSRAWCRWPRRA
jgi:peptidoglycan/LPS O-acetylase OafA/YrhL